MTFGVQDVRSRPLRIVSPRRVVFLRAVCCISIRIATCLGARVQITSPLSPMHSSSIHGRSIAVPIKYCWVTWGIYSHPNEKQSGRWNVRFFVSFQSRFLFPFMGVFQSLKYSVLLHRQ